jgi:outer membrane protein assembly factor BamB
MSSGSNSARPVARPPLLLALSLLLAACGPDELELPAREPGADPAEASPEAQEGASELDALRALGYAGVSEEELADELAGVQLHDRQRTQPGYNLYTVRPMCRVVLMDNDGEQVHLWERPAHRSWSNAQLLENGDLLVIGQERSQPYIGAVDEHRYLLRLSWDGERIWRLDLNAHHDVELNPDGSLSVLSFRRTLGSPLTDQRTELREDLVELVSLDGELLGERSIVAALTAEGSGFELGEVAPARSGGVRYLDLIHANSVEFMRRPELADEHPLYAAGNLLISTRHQDRVLVMEWESGRLVWSWGQGELLGPHDATVLDGGNLLIFDNGLGRGWSRVVELDPRKGEVVWEYKAEEPKDFYTASRGSSQRLANGNTLIAESDRGRAFEVTPQGEVVWSWINPDRDERGRVTTVVRMKRLAPEYVEPHLAR